MNEIDEINEIFKCIDKGRFYLEAALNLADEAKRRLAIKFKPEETPPPRPRRRHAELERRCVKRSQLAAELFPSLSPKNAGILMARIINNCTSLKETLEGMGYQANVEGYTIEQEDIIREFWQNHPKLQNGNEVFNCPKENLERYLSNS